uniref:Uncharacterized protein n=1 Tax=Picea glauca TaxID=3330 RepID=A0A101LZM2_PICGL|nr:hypothetical protein ABT39_MTgene5207 [Picea glauca]
MPSGGGASIRCGFRPAWDNKKRGTTCAYGVVCEWFGLRLFIVKASSFSGSCWFWFLLILVLSLLYS